ISGTPVALLLPSRCRTSAGVVKPYVVSITALRVAAPAPSSASAASSAHRRARPVNGSVPARWLRVPVRDGVAVAGWLFVVPRFPPGGNLGTFVTVDARPE